MNVYVDIDETIADYLPTDDKSDYNLATPIMYVLFITII